MPQFKFEVYDYEADDDDRLIDAEVEADSLAEARDLVLDEFALNHVRIMREWELIDDCWESLPLETTYLPGDRVRLNTPAGPGEAVHVVTDVSSRGVSLSNGETYPPAFLLDVQTAPPA